MVMCMHVRASHSSKASDRSSLNLSEGTVWARVVISKGSLNRDIDTQGGSTKVYSDDDVRLFVSIGPNKVFTLV